MSKTTKELSFNNLFVEYKILHKIDKDQADKRFTELFNEYVKQCANKLYEGDVSNVTLNRALHNNLVSDKRTRFNNADKYFNGYLPDRILKLQLVELIDTLLPAELRKVSARKTASGEVDKAFWKYTEEDIADADAKVLNSVYNNISSVLSKAPLLANAMKEFNLSEDETKAKLKAIRTLARKQKAKLSKPQLSEKLVNKLQEGGKVVLSAAEAEELRKLLG